MRRRNREINIFNMSALDLFASALGAFILLFVILMPYYLKTSKIVMKENQQLKEEIRECQTTISGLKKQNSDLQGKVANLAQQLTKCENRGKSLQKENRQLKESSVNTQQVIQKLQEENRSKEREVARYKEKLSQTFLAVVMKWSTQGDDIDLHVKDPDGNVFYYEKHNRNRRDFSNTPAELSVDTIKGPGIEIWEHPSASPGKYEISYNFYDDRRDHLPVKVTGSVYYRDGAVKLPIIILRREHENKSVAVITVNSEGDVSVH